jgi:hypothetical protein
MKYHVEDLMEKYGVYAVTYLDKPFEIVAECKSLAYAERICERLNSEESEKKALTIDDCYLQYEKGNIKLEQLNEYARLLLQEHSEPVKPKETEISLRDYFAAKAMQSLVTAYETDEFGLPKKIALRAYEYADAMLAERSKTSE